MAAGCTGCGYWEGAAAASISVGEVETTEERETELNCICSATGAARTGAVSGPPTHTATEALSPVSAHTNSQPVCGTRRALGGGTSPEPAEPERVPSPPTGGTAIREDRILRTVRSVGTPGTSGSEGTEQVHARGRARPAEHDSGRTGWDSHTTVGHPPTGGHTAEGQACKVYARRQSRDGTGGMYTKADKRGWR